MIERRGFLGFCGGLVGAAIGVVKPKEMEPVWRWTNDDWQRVRMADLREDDTFWFGDCCFVAAEDGRWETPWAGGVMAKEIG